MEQHCRPPHPSEGKSNPSAGVVGVRSMSIRKHVAQCPVQIEGPHSHSHTEPPPPLERLHHHLDFFIYKVRDEIQKKNLTEIFNYHFFHIL